MYDLTGIATGIAFDRTGEFARGLIPACNIPTTAVTIAFRKQGTPPPPPVTEAWVRFIIANPGAHRMEGAYSYDTFYSVSFYVQNNTNNKFFQRGSYTQREQDPQTGQWIYYFGNNAERDYSHYASGTVVTEYPQYGAEYYYPDYEYYDISNVQIVWYKFPAGTYRITEYSSSGNLLSSTTFTVDNTTVQDGKMTVTLNGHICPRLSISYNQVQLIINSAEITTSETSYYEYYSWDVGPAATYDEYTPAPSESNATTDLTTLGNIFNGSYNVPGSYDGDCPLSSYEEVFISIIPQIATNTTGLTCSLDTRLKPYDDPQEPSYFGQVKSYEVEIEQTVHFTPANAYWRDHWYLAGHYIEIYTGYYYEYEYNDYVLYINNEYLTSAVVRTEGSYANTRTYFPQCNFYQNYGFWYQPSSEPPPEFDDPDEIDFFVKAAWTGYDGDEVPYDLYYLISPWAEQWGGHEYSYSFNNNTKVFTLTTIAGNDQPVVTTDDVSSRWEDAARYMHSDINSYMSTTASSSGDINYGASYDFNSSTGIGDSWFYCGLKQYLTYAVP